MTGIDQDYLTEILERASEGGTTCKKEIFDGWKYLEELKEKGSRPGIPLSFNEVPGRISGELTTEEERELQRKYGNFHRHTAVLKDLGYIEVWQKDHTGTIRHIGIWGGEGEFWPKRVTANGYKALSYLKDESFAEKAKKAGSHMVIRMIDAAVKYGTQSTFNNWIGQ